MAFEWTQNISPGAPANAAGLNEIQDNLDSIFSDLSITRSGCASGAGWTEFPIPGELVTDKLSDQAQELRDVTDYAHDNKCPAHDSGYQSGVDTTEDSGYNSGHLSTGYGFHFFPYELGICPIHCPTHWTNYCPTVNQLYDAHYPD